jgi:glycosyltransferase involved in cell wall biosynthesis
LWSDKKYLDQETPWLLRPLARLIIAWLRRFDYRAAQTVDHFIANSVEVQQRIKRFYGRESTLIQPFVNTAFWQPTRPKQDYFLLAGRLHAHKNNEIIVEIFNQLGWPLHIVGTGRQESYLRSIAKPNSIFLGRVSDEVLRDEYSGAEGFIYPQLEDFGLMPLEAAACGTASLGLAQGGSLETIIPGQTGELFQETTVNAITEKLVSWDPGKYDAAALRAHAEKFSEEVFKQKISTFIEELSKVHVSQ